MGSRTGHWVGGALALWVSAVAASAQAGGLVVSATDGDSTAEQLAPLATFHVSAELDDEGAQVVEQRFYTQTAPLPVVTLTGRFYRSILGPEGARLVSVTLNGAPLEGEVLDAAAADALRRERARTLGEPSPLRELGTPLFVSEPVDLPNPAYGVAVSVETWVPWRERGTLSGVDVPLDWSPEDVGQVTLDVAARTTAPLRALYSPYHALSVSRTGERDATATYEGSAVCTRFDLTLLMSSGNEAPRLDVLPFRYGEADGGHLLALITPQATAPEGEVEGRDIVLVLDVSGSMAGEKIEQARDALGAVLARLSPADRVAVIAFSSAVDAFSTSVLAASADNVRDARDFVDALAAAGGTNLHGALDAALGALPNDGERPRYVVLLTDGQPTEGVTDVDAIVELAATFDGPRVRVFPFGIGYDVNTHLLDRLAGETGGQAIYVRPAESVADPVAAFFARIEDPLLTAPRLAFEGLGVADVHPAELPDLFAGETVALFARYASPGAGTVRLTGTSAGRSVTHDFAVSLPEHALEAGFVPRVWALREVGALLSALKLGGAGTDAEAELARVAERYGVITDFTGFELDDDGDARFVYTPVTSAASGAAAVEASASIDGYAQGVAVDAAVATELRYQADRAFASVGGYYTDTTLASEPDWVELRFGSERYFELAASHPFAAGMLAIGRDVRFEWLGHAYRVTDPGGALADALPEEVAELPEPLRTLADPDDTLTAVSGAGRTALGDADPDAPASDDARLADAAAGADADAHHVQACHVAHPGAPTAWPAWLLLPLLAWRARARRRRAA